MTFGWHRNRIILTMLLIGLVFSYSVNSFAQTPSEAITSGTQWLLSARYGMGIWAFKEAPNPLQEEFTVDDFTPTYIRDTLEAVTALQDINASTTEYESTLDWIESFNFPSTAQLSQKIHILSKASRDVSKTVSNLLNVQNTDGGFGGASGYPSSVLDTAFALKALKAAKSTNTTTTDVAISYILSAQNSDGGFGFYKGRNSNVYMTAMVSYTLQQWTKTTSTATGINKATSYLIAHQNADGGFGNSGIKRPKIGTFFPKMGKKVHTL